METITQTPTQTQVHGVDPGQVIALTRRILAQMPYLLIEDAERIAAAILIFDVDERNIQVFVSEVRR